MSSKDNVGDLSAGDDEKQVRPPLQYLIIISGAGSLAIGVLGIIGLHLGVTALTSVWLGDKPIALSAALAWIFFGLILIVYARHRLSFVVKALVGVMLAIIAIAAALELPLNLQGRHFLVENLINSVATPFIAGTLTHISPVATLLIIPEAIGLFLLIFIPEKRPGNRREQSVIGIIGLFCAASGFLFMMSYIYGSPFLYGTNIIPIAFYSTLASLFVGAGLIATAGPDAFPLVYFSGPTTRARLLRVFVPFTIAIILIQNLLFIVLTSILQFHQAIGLAINIVLFCIFTGTIVIIVAGNIGKVIDRESEMRKKAELELLEANEYLQNLINYANAPIIVWDPKFRITRFNHAFEHLTGRNEQEVIGKDLSILFPESSKDASFELIEKTLTGERWEVVEIPILNMSGGTRIVLWNSANIIDPSGKVISTIAQGHDITERKKTEEQREILIKDLEQKNAELERFTYTVSHDLKSPLITIRGFSDILGEDIKKNDISMVFRDLERINTAAQKMEILLKDLLNLSRIGRIVNPPENVPFGEIANEVC